MTTNVASRARWTIDSASQGNKKLRKLRSVEETDNADLEHVFNTGDDEPAGIIDKPGATQLDIEYYFEAGEPEVNWRALKRAKEFFTLTKEMVPGGERLQYNRCRVANVAGSGDDQGSHMQKVKIVCNAPEEL